MSAQNTTLIAETEAARLCANDLRSMAATMAAIRRNLTSWEQAESETGAGFHWSLLDAYMARTYVQEHPGSAIYLERMDFCRSVASRLLERDGKAYVLTNMAAARICYRFAFDGFTDPGPRRLPRRDLFS